MYFLSPQALYGLCYVSMVCKEMQRNSDFVRFPLTHAHDTNFNVTLSLGCFIRYQGFPATKITESFNSHLVGLGINEFCLYLFKLICTKYNIINYFTETKPNYVLATTRRYRVVDTPDLETVTHLVPTHLSFQFPQLILYQTCLTLR